MLRLLHILHLSVYNQLWRAAASREHRAGWELGERVGECEHDGEESTLSNAPVRHEMGWGLGWGWVGASRMGAFRRGWYLPARWVLRSVLKIITDIGF